MRVSVSVCTCMLEPDFALSCVTALGEVTPVCVLLLLT